MIAIMPNTISREILSAGGRATARVANRAKNNNEMSDGEQDGTAERMAENRAGRDGRVKEESIKRQATEIESVTEDGRNERKMYASKRAECESARGGERETEEEYQGRGNGRRRRGEERRRRRRGGGRERESGGKCAKRLIDV